MKINEFIVVEGRDDTERVKSAVECDTIETNGSAINKETLAVIQNAQETRGVGEDVEKEEPFYTIGGTATGAGGTGTAAGRLTPACEPGTQGHGARGSHSYRARRPGGAKPRNAAAHF